VEAIMIRTLEEEDNFQAIAEFNDDQWDNYAEGLVSKKFS
jgi:hypothetical protein